MYSCVDTTQSRNFHRHQDLYDKAVQSVAWVGTLRHLEDGSVLRLRRQMRVTQSDTFACSTMTGTAYQSHHFLLPVQAGSQDRSHSALQFLASFPAIAGP